MATAPAHAMAGARTAQTPLPGRLDPMSGAASSGGVSPSGLGAPAAAAGSLSLPDEVPGPIAHVLTGPVGKRRALMIGVATLAIGGLAIGGAALLSRAGAPDAASTVAPTALGSIEIRSDPPGAQILLDGSPSGRLTPTVVTGLPLGRSVRVELSKDGYGPTAVILHPEAERPAPHVVKLVQTGAVVRLVELPRHASVFLDGVQVDTDGAIETTVGRHEVRVEVKGKIAFLKVLDVRAGEQITSVGLGKSEP
jgi:hypothetical protein